MSLLLSGPMLKLPAAGGGITDPTDVGAVVWLDMTDFTYLKQNTAGTTAVAAASDPVRYLVDRTSETNDFETRAGSSAGTAQSGHVAFNLTNFKPDAALTGLTSNCEIFALIRTSDTNFGIAGKDTLSSHLLGYALDSGTSTDPTAGFSDAGPVIYSTDGVDESSPFASDLSSAWATGNWVIASARQVDLTDATDTDISTLFMPLGYNVAGASAFVGDVMHYIITPALTTQERSDLVDWLKTEGSIA